MNRGIEAAIVIAGDTTTLAKHLGRSASLVRKYRTGKVAVPLRMAIMLDQDKRFKVPRWWTRPDVFKEGDGR